MPEPGDVWQMDISSTGMPLPQNSCARPKMPGLVADQGHLALAAT